MADTWTRGVGFPELVKLGDAGSTDEVYALVVSQAERLDPAGADQRMTVDATVGGVQFSAFPTGTSHVVITCETAQVRVTFDGTAPTTTNGHILEPGFGDAWSVATAEAAKFIRTGATSGVVHASPMKQ